MSEDVTQGVSSGVATAENGVVPTQENVLDQAAQVADNAGAQTLTGTPPPAEQTSLTLTPEQMDAAMKQGAEAGKAILEQAPGPAKEFEGTSAQPLNPANPIGTPDSASLNATHQEMVDAKAQAAAEPQKKGGIFGFIKKLSPIKAQTVERKVDEKSEPKPAAPPSPGLGLAPATNTIEAVPSAVSPGGPVSSSQESQNPLSVGQELAKSGQTNPVPGVSPEAQAAVSATTTIGETGEAEKETQAPEASAPANETTEPKGNALPGAVEEMHKTEEQAWNRNINGEQKEPVASPAPAESPSPSISETSLAVGDAKIEEAPDAHPDIVGYDKNVAAQGAATDNAMAAENKVEAEHPDLLAVDQNEAHTPEDASESSAPVFTPTEETTDAIANASNFPDHPREDDGSLPITASQTPPPVEDASKWTSANFPGQVQTEVQGVPTSSSSQGNSETASITPTSPETVTPPPSEPTAPEVLSPFGTTNSSGTQSSFESSSTTSSASESIPPAPVSAESAAAVPAASEPAEQTTPAFSPVTETSSDIGSPDSVQGPVAVASSGPIEPPADHTIDVPASPAASVEPPAPVGLAPSTSEIQPPSNVTGIIPDVTPEAQTSEQIAAAQGGTGPAPIAQTPGNISAIRPDVQIQPNGLAPAEPNQEATAQDQAA